jgi:hypothetical protein
MAWMRQDFDNVEAAIWAVRDGERKTLLLSESGVQSGESMGRRRRTIHGSALIKRRSNQHLRRPV